MCKYTYIQSIPINPTNFIWNNSSGGSTTEMESQLKLQNALYADKAKLRDNDTALNLSGGDRSVLITNIPLNKRESFAVTFSAPELTKLEFGLYEPEDPQDTM